MAYSSLTAAVMGHFQEVWRTSFELPSEEALSADLVKLRRKPPYEETKDLYGY
jgi:hypothetical protein